jgi:dihydropyrimidinase
VTDLVVRGGTVVTPAGSFRADVAIAGDRIEAVGADLAADGVAALDARGLLVLPGVVDVHTHTRLPSEDEPDRFFRDSVAAALGGTTTFLCFDNPGTGISDEGARDPLAGVREFRARTEGESAVDFGLSAVLTGQQADPAGAVPRLIEAGVPTFKAFMVYDFRLDEAGLAQVLAATAARPAMLQLHCEAPAIIDALVAEALAAGRTAPREHAACRPTSAEAQATARAIELASAARAPLYVVHLSCAAALAHVARAKAGGRPVFAETCPHYLTLGDDRYELPDEEAIKAVISPPLRSAADGDALWRGLADGSLDLVATDHVPDRLAVEKRLPAPPFPEISNGGPGIETLLSVVYSEGVAGGRSTAERLVDLLAASPARLFGLGRKGAVEAGRDADLVLFDPSVRRTIRQADLHHTSDYTPYEGMAVSGAVRHVLLRGRQIVEDGRYVGRRGDGRFQERKLAWR